MKLYEYRAVGKGTLSRPYRFFDEGDVIKSKVELNHPALVPIDTPVAKKSDVIVPYMTIDGRKQRPDYSDEGVFTVLANEGVQGKSKGVPPTVANPVYEQAMAGIKRMEQLIDNATPVTVDPNPAPAADKETAEAGTGNQDVLS